MTINELKDYLKAKLDNLENNFEGDEEVRLTSNTYFLKTNGDILETSEGFLDIDFPLGEEEF